MDKVIKRIQIDLYSPTCYEVIKAQQGDNGLRVVEFEILNQGEPCVLSNVLAKLEGHRGDGSSFIKDCTVLGNIVSVVLDGDILYDAGTIEAKVVLYDLSSAANTTEIELLSTISTIPFKIYAQKNPCDKNGVLEKQSIADYIMSAFINVQGLTEGAYANFSFIKQILDLLIYNAYIKDDSDGNTYKICSNQGKLYFMKTDDVLTDLLSQLILNTETVEVEIENSIFSTKEDAVGFVYSSSNDDTAYCAFDDDINTYWTASESDDIEGEYISYKFNVPIQLDTVTITANNDNANISWKIQGSNNGQSWDDLTDIYTPRNNRYYEEHEFSTFLNSNYYTQFRVYLTSGRQSWSYGAGFNHISFKGHYTKEVAKT